MKKLPKNNQDAPILIAFYEEILNLGGKKWIN